MTASTAPAAAPAAGAATAAPVAPSGQPASAPLTRVALAYLEHRFKLYLRFGEPARTLQLDRWRRCAVFLPGAMLCRIRWQANDYGTIRWQLMVMKACTPLDAAQRIPGVQPGARLLLHTEGDANVRTVLERIDPFDPRTVSLPRPLSVDSIVLVPLPDTAAMLAAQRGYLPTRVPLLKRVGAVAPQNVCIVARQVRIDGVPTAAALPVDRLGRPLPSWPHCRPLAEGELFLLSVTNPASFDSRYFGPVSASAVIGVAHPVWLETRP